MHIGQVYFFFIAVSELYVFSKAFPLTLLPFHVLFVFGCDFCLVLDQIPFMSGLGQGKQNFDDIVRSWVSLLNPYLRSSLRKLSRE